jgi:hypothetical protein
MSDDRKPVENALPFDTHEFWIRFREALNFGSAPVIIGGGVLGMIIGTIASVSYYGQWTFIGIGMLVGIAICMAQNPSGHY